MVIENVAATSIGNPSTPNSVTTDDIDTTGANFIVVAASYAKAVSVTLTDSKSNTWVPLTARAGPAFAKVQFFYSVTPTVGAGHNFTLTGTGEKATIAAIAYSGVKTSSPFDVQSGNAAASVDALGAGTVTPSEDDELIICALSKHIPQESVGIDGGFIVGQEIQVEDGQYFGLAVADLVQTTAGAVNPTWSWPTDAEATAVIATFKSSIVHPAADIPKLFVQADPAAPQRSRAHEKTVADLLNSLIRQGYIELIGASEWKIVGTNSGGGDGSVDRYISSGETLTIEDKHSVVMVLYLELAGTGSVVLQGDADLEII